MVNTVLCHTNLKRANSAQKSNKNDSHYVAYNCQLQTIDSRVSSSGQPAASAPLFRKGRRTRMTFQVTPSTRLQHGPISCLSCFSTGSAPGCTVKRATWRIDNNPGYWGGAAPEVLVLGFSKGANQRSVLEFDRIAFANARENLAEVLRALDLLDAADDIDLCFTANSAKLGFASVIRCGLGLEVEPDKYATSGDVVRAAIAPDSKVRDLFDTCTDRCLRVLPASVRTVVFLGLDGPYVQALYERIRELHPSVNRISELAYATNAVTFVHVVHPSPLATSHRQSWLRDDNSSLADKRRQVAAALGNTGYAPTIGPKTSKKILCGWTAA